MADKASETARAADYVAYGVTVTEDARRFTPTYHVTGITDDGVIVILPGNHKSWNDATAASKAMAADAGAPYWIADNVKAFQRKVAARRAG